MVVRIRYYDPTSKETMTVLFGNSYKKWYRNAEEFEQKLPHLLRETTVEVSEQPWIAFKGLKWCAEELFQQELDAEGRGRKVEEFIFIRRKSPPRPW